jgi:hypothetical protein
MTHCGHELPQIVLEGTETGVRIAVLVSTAFPAGTYRAAVGGPCVQRGFPHPTTVVAVTTLNADKFADGIGTTRLRFVAHHEMGHALGLAGLVQGFSPPWLDPAPCAYRGHLALFGYHLDSGGWTTELSGARRTLGDGRAHGHGCRPHEHVLHLTTRRRLAHGLRVPCRVVRGRSARGADGP